MLISDAEFNESCSITVRKAISFFSIEVPTESSNNPCIAKRLNSVLEFQTRLRPQRKFPGDVHLIPHSTLELSSGITSTIAHAGNDADFTGRT